VKGAELELMRFKHPFLDFDVPAILGDHVAGRGYRCGAYRRQRSGRLQHQPKYGLEIANPVGPDIR
jgi:isoleucyl-tRNA synthetase